MDLLQEARTIINDVDSQMADLFIRRMQAAEMVAQYKKAHGMPILDAEREEAVIRNGSARVADETLRGYYIDFMRDTMAVSRRYQQRLLQGMKVAYSGTEGAFAHIAADRLFPQAEKAAYPDFKSAYYAVVDGECDVVVLPLENSYAGEVGQVTDLMFSGPLYVNHILPLSVTHDLLAVEGASLESIKTVVSHPQALSQCDQSQVNTTRFAVLSKAENRNVSNQHGAHFILVFTVRNEAGSLAQALNVIGSYGFNMRTLRSRPMGELLWQYYFYMEAEGNIHSPDGENMLKRLAVYCDKIKCVGSFT